MLARCFLAFVGWASAGGGSEGRDAVSEPRAPSAQPRAPMPAVAAGGARSGIPRGVLRAPSSGNPTQSLGAACRLPAFTRADTGPRRRNGWVVRWLPRVSAMMGWCRRQGGHVRLGPARDMVSDWDRPGIRCQIGTGQGYGVGLWQGRDMVSD
jgi:hypothetical protein